MENCTKKLSYSQHSLAFAEYACNNFSYYKEQYAQFRRDFEESILFKFTSKEMNTKINKYRPSNTTAEAAIKLVSLESENKELRQLNLLVHGIERALNSFSPILREWVENNLIDKTSATDKNKKYSLQDKRIRKFVLSNICNFMGLPEDKLRRENAGSKIKR